MYHWPFPLRDAHAQNGLWEGSFAAELGVTGLGSASDPQRRGLFLISHSSRCPQVRTRLKTAPQGLCFIIITTTLLYRSVFT